MEACCHVSLSQQDASVEQGDKGAQCLILDAGVLGGEIDVSGIHQKSVLVGGLLFELEWKDADGGSPLLNALGVIGFEHPCSPQNLNLLGSDLWL